MKQNSCPIVNEVTKPAGIGLDELDGTVEAFSAGVADSVLTKVQQSFLVAPEHLDDLFDRLQLATHRVVRPCFEESLCRTLVGPCAKSCFLPAIYTRRILFCALSKAAEAGVPAAMRHLADLYESSFDLPKDEEKSLAWTRRAALADPNNKLLQELLQLRTESFELSKSNK